MKECIEVGEIRVWPARSGVYLSVDVGGLEFVVTPKEAGDLIAALAEGLSQIIVGEGAPSMEVEE